MKKLALLAILVPALALAMFENREFEIGNWRSYFSNYGSWGHDSSRAGGFWRDSQYVYGAGLWVGAILNDADTLVTVGYNPNSAKSEMFPTLCRYWREGSGSPRDRIYSYPGDWPPPRSRFPMAPDSAVSDIELWNCCCDSDPAQHTVPGRPLGLDILLTVLAFSDSLSRDVFYLHYELSDPGPDSLKGVYAGLMMDPDIANATDDRAGLILNRHFSVGGDTFTVRSTGFCWSEDNVPSGAVAARLLKGPRSDSLAAFRLFVLSNDPTSDFSQYLALTGHDWYPPYPYNPFDSLDQTPEDKRFLLSTGPFDIAPQAAETLLFAIIGAPFDPTDTSELALRAEWARKRWDRHVGVQEEMPSADRQTPNCGPTIVRGVLFSPASLFTLHSSLFDMTGRQVMVLKPGANDVTRLSPGVYFVRPAQGVTRDASGITKVVVTR
jgi:hypothetical protein